MSVETSAATDRSTTSEARPGRSPPAAARIGTGPGRAGSPRWRSWRSGSCCSAAGTSTRARSSRGSGLASFESFGPFGQVFGGWDPSIWPGQLAPALAWAWGEGELPTSASVRWPAAIAGVWIGLILVATGGDRRSGAARGCSSGSAGSGAWR